MTTELMQCGNWEEAWLYWRELDISSGLEERESYHAYARCCEVLGDWDTHQDVVDRGIKNFPSDTGFLSRTALRMAMMAYDLGHWSLALNLFSALGNAKPDSWPYAVSFFRWRSFLMSEVSVCVDVNKQVEVISYWSYFKNANLFSRQAVGLEDIVRLTWGDEAGRLFLGSFSSLLDILEQTDSPLIELDANVMKLAIGRLATACTLCIEDVLKLPNGYLFFLARLFLMTGEGELYLKLRNAFIRGLEFDFGRFAELRDVNLFYRIAYEFEISGYPNIEGLQKLVMDRFSYTPRIAEKMMSLGRLYQGGSEIGQDEAWEYDSADLRFKKMIEGKRIAIVGPVDVGLDNGAEIDEFDLIVRFNYRHSVVLDSKAFGTRADISFYIYQDLKGGERDYVEAMNGLSFVAVDDISLAECDWLSRVVSPIRTRLATWRFDTCPFLFGSPNAVQRAIMDVVRFSPAEIKVFNSNLFLNLNYSGGYRRPVKSPFPEFSRHDPVSNFIFTQKVYRSGLIGVDAVLEEILKLTPDQYFSRLISAYK